MSNEMPKHILAEQDYIDGMKYIDIAEKYKVSINTVKSWKKRHGWTKEKGAHKSEKGCTQKRGAGAEKKRAIAEEVEQVLSNPELTDKQRLFCLYYTKLFNATKAYLKAYGGSYEVAMVEGSNLLRKPKIKDEIYRLKLGKLNRAMFDETDLFQKYMDIACADITDFVEFGQEDIPVMAMYGPVMVDNPDTGEKVQLTKRVNTVRFREHTEVDGTLISEVKMGRDGASIKLSDRMKAMDWLDKHMGLASEEQRAKIEYTKAQIARIQSDSGETKEGVMIVDDIPDESQPD